MLRVAALRVVLCRVRVVIDVPEFACLAGVIAGEIVPVGPTLPIVVVVFDIVEALWHVVSCIAAAVLVVVAVSGPRAIVRIVVVAVAIVVVAIAIAIAIVVVVSIVVVVVLVVVVVVVTLPLL